MIAVFTALAFADPMPGLTHTRSQMRRFDCERMGMREGASQYPGRVVDSASRAVDPDRVVVVCTERWMRLGLRAPGDEATLATLEPSSAEIAALAASSWPELEGRTWLVEAFHPTAVVASKVSFAMKNALVRQGLTVSDRTPALSAGDVQALAQMAPLDAYPEACRIYAATGGVGEGDVLLAVAKLDPRETTMHAGLCVRGGFTWLR
jgi:hypothetical protein